ncbi:MAG: type I DNA topoisomerase [Tannerellaceae bacterium]|nr:type I DNA topoisomerase [Tannerellaceae bacterium]
MQKNLVIVESPAKAKTIEKFLGKDFKVMSSYGHIRDLRKNKFSIDVDNNYAPEYVVPTDKRKIVTALKAGAKKADTVWLASDEDREGEAISWHLAQTLGLDMGKTRRIAFHEITKDAILHAIETPREIDVNLVDAQQARRVLDRIVGFELSPVLWRKVRPSLSAGRVQSVAVRLIVEREREINAFVSEASFRVTASLLLGSGATLNAELNRRPGTEAEARSALEAIGCAKLSVDDISRRPVKKSPAPPFTTSTLQQEASRKLGYSVSQTMMLAQRLYEAGEITYMRTDSVNLSSLALATASEAIKQLYGEAYHRARRYTTKSKGAQEAHEAIRPTFIANEVSGGGEQEKKLYDLIRKRTLASQMADAELERTTIQVGVPGARDRLVVTGEVIVFDGFLKVYREGDDEEGEREKVEDGVLPAVAVGDGLTLTAGQAAERFTQRPPRYTEASLVRRMEELGIGRPSTYAPTINTIQNREYVLKGDKEGRERSYTVLTLAPDRGISARQATETTGADRGKLMPTDTGIVVNDFLTEYFPHVLDYNFTANVEKEFDAIADGEMVWTDAIDSFYKVFHPMVEETKASRTHYKAGERRLGTDPATGHPVLVRIGRYGPMAQIGVADPGDTDAPKPRFAPLMRGQSIESITLDEALRLFDLPRILGLYEDKEVTASVGRFGPFIRHEGKFITIPKGLDPLRISLEEAIGLVDDKRRKDAERLLRRFDEDPGLEIRKGRFGPYIFYGGKNYRIPSTVDDPLAISHQDALALIGAAADKPAAPAKRGRKRKG